LIILPLTENTNFKRGGFFLSQIKLHEITKKYSYGRQSVVALNKASLSFEKGEFASIVGSSGSGKSTLMNILGCLDCPDSGEYYLNGELINNASYKALNRIRSKTIGFVFQSFHLINSMTAIENVELPLIYQKIPKAKRKELALKALKQVGLLERKEHIPSKMSGGQRQRTAIARAIASSPSIILADEPTGNLDSDSSRDVMNILKELNSLGRAVILITHDQDIAEQTERVIEIRDGRIIKDQKNS